MAVFNPYIQAKVQDPYLRDGYLERPPIVIPIHAAHIHEGSAGTSDGVYHAAAGEHHGTVSPLLQDTFLTGTAMRTGRDFTAVTGNWYDDLVNPKSDKYICAHLNATLGVNFDLKATTTTPKIEAADFVLRRGVMPGGLTPTATNFFCYIELCAGNKQNYRIAFVWGQPIRLEYTVDSGVTWGAVSVAKDLPHSETFFRTHKDTAHVRVIPYHNEGLIFVQIGNGVPLTHAPDKTSGDGLGADKTLNLPNPGKPRLVGQNGWASLAYHPLRFQTLNVTSKTYDMGKPNPNAGGAFVTSNARAKTNASQTTTGAVSTDGQKFQVKGTATEKDAGDGKGSADPARISELYLVIPAVWSDSVEGLPPLTPPTFFNPMRFEPVEVFNDVSRTVTCSAMVTVNNFNYLYSGAYGNLAIDIYASNGVTGTAKAFGGVVAGDEQGIHFIRHDPTGLMMLDCRDNSHKMQVPLGQEALLDGWYDGNAAQYLAEVGNIHPSFFPTPPYIPPGATAQAPYGPAGYDLPANFYALDRGTGLQAKHKYSPDDSPWRILQSFAQRKGDVDPITGTSIPYYLGFIPGSEPNMLTLSAYDPSQLQPVFSYSDRDNSGLGQIEWLSVYNSIEQMVSEINFQGIDAIQNDLIQGHLPMPAFVQQLIGWRKTWLDRSAVYSSQQAITDLMTAAAAQASSFTQIVQFQAPYHPFVHAGCLILVGAQELGRVGLYVVNEIRSAVGIRDVFGRSGEQDCYSIITARSAENYLTH